MQCTQILIVFSAVLLVCLASDRKLKEKTVSKPVRLITEEELEIYDGSQVMKKLSLWLHQLTYISIMNECL